MAELTKASKIALASLITYARSLPKESFNCNFGIKISPNSELTPLLSRLESSSKDIGQICDLKDFNNQPFNKLFEHFVTKGTAKLREATKYRSLLLELTIDDFKYLKYILPNILNKSSQVVFLLKDFNLKPQGGIEHTADMQVRGLYNELAWCLNSNTTSCDPMASFMSDGACVISTAVSSSKFQCLSNYASRGYLTEAEDGSDPQYLAMMPNFKDETKGLKQGQKPNMKVLRNFTMNEAFGPNKDRVLVKQTWAGSFEDKEHSDQVIKLLQEIYPEENWNKPYKPADSSPTQVEFSKPLINLPHFK